jgi:hypothetical protein
MVRKGSTVRVRQRAFINRAKTRLSRFRSGSYDHFRELPSEKGSSMAAVRRCAAVHATAERVLLQVQGTDAVHAQDGISVATALRIGGEAFDADHQGAHPVAVGAA